ncbi:MAG: enoyl-CoA hydratase-related protein [Bacillota bacterium]|nr:enoyl-CoA hydratase-related protein [Bacillota bacterium]
MPYSYTIEDEIVVFKFTNGKVNSINMETLQGLNEVIDRVNAEEELKGIVLTGEGKYFSSGFDLNTFTSFKSPEAIKEWFDYEEELLYKLFTCSKPVVTAVNGHATAAGMIVSMACDYRIAVNNPRIKMGMTEIKIGLALTPAEGEIMRFGLDTDKKFRDVIFAGELFNPATAVEKGIFDELVEDQEELITRAKEKVCSFIDTPGRPFILLKYLEKQHAADYIRKGIDTYDFNLLVKIFTDPTVLGTLNMVKQALGI